jgi:hypothetical protein
VGVSAAIWLWMTRGFDECHGRRVESEVGGTGCEDEDKELRKGIGSMEMPMLSAEVAIDRDGDCMATFRSAP